MEDGLSLLNLFAQMSFSVFLIFGGKWVFSRDLPHCLTCGGLVSGEVLYLHSLVADSNNKPLMAWGLGHFSNLPFISQGRGGRIKIPT